jgi:hypothetical protein
MKLAKIAISAAIGALMIAPANAQLGGLKAKVPGASPSENNASNVTAQDVDAFIIRAEENVQLLDFSLYIFKGVRDQKINDAGFKAKAKEILKNPDPKERNAIISNSLKGDDAAGKINEEETAKIEEFISKQSPETKALIGAALINLAIAVPRAVSLAKDVPDLIKGLGKSPAALGQAGKLKTAAGLIGQQVKYTADIAPLLPRLMSAAKVKMPANAETSKGMPYPGI